MLSPKLYNNMSPQQQVINRCHNIFTRAEKLYHVDMSDIAIRFDLRGVEVGEAIYDYDEDPPYILRFNLDVMERGSLKCILNDTVPHEIAHIVCFKDPELGDEHDSGWRQVCIALGGSGKSTHDQEVVFANGYTFEYTSDRGNRIRVDHQCHRIVESGKPVTFMDGLGTISHLSPYSIVGFQGRIFHEPLHKRI